MTSPLASARLAPPTAGRRGAHLAARTCATLLCVGGVPLLILALVHWLYGVPISAFRPVINDEVTYWHQVLTFSRAGFNGGYYTIGEVTNASGITPFGPHGAGYPMLYGLFGAAFGWHRHDVVVLNLLTIGAAAWLWISLAQVGTARLLLAGLLLVTFWPMVFWAASGMQESLHHAAAIAGAAFFACAARGHASRWIVISGWIVLTIVAYIRPSWVVLMPLWAMLTTQPGSVRRLSASVAGSALLALFVIIAFSRTTAPVPNSFFFVSWSDIPSAARAVWSGVSFNVQRTFGVSDYMTIEIVHRLQYWGWLLALSVTAAVLLQRARRGDGHAPPHLLVALAAIAPVVVGLFLFYSLTNWAEHRIVSAFLLFGALLCTAAPGRAPVLLAAALTISNVAAAGLFVREFEAGHRDQFVWDRRSLHTLEDALADQVVYRADQPRWCNTLLTSQFPPSMIAVPAGIGLSIVREADRLAMPPRSRYLLLDERLRAEFTAPLNVKAIATLPYGTLYLNLDARCGASTSAR